MIRDPWGKLDAPSCRYRLHLATWVLFDGIPAGLEVSTSMTINAPAAVLLSPCTSRWERKAGCAWHSLTSGTLQNDMLKECTSRRKGGFILGRVKLIVDTKIQRIHHRTHAEKYNPIGISWLPHPGSEVRQRLRELAFTIADAMTYVGRLHGTLRFRCGLVRSSLSFFWNSIDFLQGRSRRFRAARRLWARIMRDKYGAKDPEIMAHAFSHANGRSPSRPATREQHECARRSRALAAGAGGDTVRYQLHGRSSQALPRRRRWCRRPPHLPADSHQPTTGNRRGEHRRDPAGRLNDTSKGS